MDHVTDIGVLDRINRSSHQKGYVRRCVLRNLTKFTGKHLHRISFLLKLQACGWHRCFPLNFPKFLRTTFFTEHLRVTAFKANIYDTVFFAKTAISLNVNCFRRKPHHRYLAGSLNTPLKCFKNVRKIVRKKPVVNSFLFLFWHTRRMEKELLYSCTSAFIINSFQVLVSTLLLDFHLLTKYSALQMCD